MSLNPGQRRSLGLVGALIGATLVALTFYLTGMKVGLFLTGLLSYEGMTLVNSHAGDTISEAIWKLASRPLVPLLFGMGLAWALTAGIITSVWLAVATGVLYGHFFWQTQQVYDSANK